MQSNYSTGLACLLLLPFLLVGCTTLAPSPEPEPVIADSIEQIAGIWQSSIGYYQFSEDGTHEFGHSREGLSNHLKSAPEGEHWFADELHFHASRICEPPRGISEPGVYEVQILQSGDLRCIAIEDECPMRKTWLARYAEVNADFLWTPSE